jgi:hypothetical protein
VKFVLPILCCFVATQTQAQTTVVPQTYPGAPPRPTVVPQPTPTVGVVGGRGGPQKLKFIPPEEFDRPYTAGPIVMIEAKDQAHVKQLCPDFKFEWGPALACTYMQGATCRITLAAYPVITAAGYDPALVLRHEMGHCNGWGADHKGAR